MAIIIPFLFLLIGCAEENKDTAVPIDGALKGYVPCRYTEPVEVNFEFEVATATDVGRYDVEFVVKQKGEKELHDIASLSEECKNDFQSKKSILGTVKHIEAGTCSPIVFAPKGLSSDCWR